MDNAAVNCSFHYDITIELYSIMVFHYGTDQSHNNLNTLIYYTGNCQQNCHEIGPLRVLKIKEMFQFLSYRKIFVMNLTKL